MKYLVLFLFSSLFATSDPTNLLLTKDLKPTQGLIELLQIDNLYDPSDNLNTLVVKTQKK